MRYAIEGLQTKNQEAQEVIHVALNSHDGTPQGQCGGMLCMLVSIVYSLFIRHSISISSIGTAYNYAQAPDAAPVHRRVFKFKF